MRTFLLIGFMVASVVAAGADKKPDQRKPSTPEEREKVIAFARELEADPLGKRSDDLRSAIVSWIIDVPDLKLTVCAWFPELLDDKHGKKKYSTELIGQSVVAGAAFIAEYPELQEDLPLVTAAIVDSTLRTYEAILRQHPKVHWSSLDDLLSKRKTGDIPAVVRQISQQCDPKLTPASAPTDTEQQSQWMDSLFRLGQKLHDQQRYQGALLIYERILEAAPDAGGVLYEVGNTFLALGNMDKSVEYLHHALAANPKCWHCLMALGNAYDDSGRPEGALDFYRKAIDLAPNEGAPLFNLAVTLNRLNRTPEAVQMLEKAISLQPKYASPYYNLAIFLCKQGECYRAEQTMRKFLELETSGPRAEQAQSLLRPNFSINPGHLDKRGKEIAAFARYGIVRGEWILEKHRQQDPGAKSYEPSLEEEVDALSQQATAWRESKRLDARLKEPELDRLLHIADSGHLEAFAAWSFCSQHPQRCTDAQRSSEAVRRLNQWAAANSVELKPIQQRGVLNWMGRKWD